MIVLKWKRSILNTVYKQSHKEVGGWREWDLVKERKRVREIQILILVHTEWVKERERELSLSLSLSHTHTHTHRVTAKVTSRTLIDEAYERSRERNRNSCMYVYLHKHPSVNHTNPHTSFLLCEALTHTLSLLTSLAVTSAPCWMRMFKQSIELELAAQWRGVWGKGENVKRN